MKLSISTSSKPAFPPHQRPASLFQKDLTGQSVTGYAFHFHAIGKGGLLFGANFKTGGVCSLLAGCGFFLPAVNVTGCAALAQAMDPLFIAHYHFRHRRLEECAKACTKILEKNPFDQVSPSNFFLLLPRQPTL